MTINIIEQIEREKVKLMSGIDDKLAQAFEIKIILGAAIDSKLTYRQIKELFEHYNYDWHTIAEMIIHQGGLHMFNLKTRQFGGLAPENIEVNQLYCLGQLTENVEDLETEGTRMGHYYIEFFQLDPYPDGLHTIVEVFGIQDIREW